MAITGPSSLGRKGGLLDTTPQIRPAGKVTVLGRQSNERQTTPPEIKKYRQSTIHEPGKIVKHYGLADDAVPQAEAFGIKTQSDPKEHVGAVIQNYPQSELMQWHLEQMENIYASTKHEPLGKTLSRGHAIPGHMGKERPFGTNINAVFKNKNPESKALIYPVDVPEDDPEGTHHQKYVKSHGDYAPGEQRRRGYDWDKSGIDPREQVFGRSERLSYLDGVAKALNPTKDDGYKCSAEIVQKRLKDFKMTNNEELGKSMNLGHGKMPPEGHTYGVASRRFDEWGAGRLLSGDYSEEEQLPDPDLGKSLRKGFRNDTEETRAFGAPTIRTDIVAPKVKSVADNQNYGNEPDAASLLYPAGGAERGVVDEDYLAPMTPEEMMSFYASAGIAMDAETFEACYAKAAEVDALPGGKCCINTFQKVKNYLSWGER